MPKAPATRSRSKTTRDAPITKPSTKKPPTKKSAKNTKAADEPAPETQPPAKPSSSTAKSPNKKDPKASHLYTDDNPSTTLHGTGFSSFETAVDTLQLISARSLTYQHQTVNTLYHRAKGHPHKTPGIKSAIATFELWLTEKYPAEKAAQRDFKPLLSKTMVERFLPLMREDKVVDERFAEMYVTLPPRKRLANVLVDEKNPQGRDWEAERLAVLQELVPAGKEFGEEDLWLKTSGVKKVSSKHLQMVAWAWSPVNESRLPHEESPKDPPNSGRAKAAAAKSASK
ncbi:MAG: hypothetical protein M1831_000658 [Alyxoria varia]|nr:MAG: hypothetical protein M1831_000658 [Alyxoria varia]